MYGFLFRHQEHVGHNKINPYSLSKEKQKTHLNVIYSAYQTFGVFHFHRKTAWVLVSDTLGSESKPRSPHYKTTFYVCYNLNASTRRISPCKFSTRKARTHSFRWNIMSRCRFLPTKVEKSNASNLCFTIGCLWFHTRRRMGSREAATTAMVIDWAERLCHAPGQPSVSLNEISGYWLNAVIFNLWSKLLWMLPLYPGFSSLLL